MLYRVGNQWMSWPMGLGASIFGGGAPQARLTGGSLFSGGSQPTIPTTSPTIVGPAATTPTPTAPTSSATAAPSSGSGLPDSAPLPGYVTWVVNNSSANPGEFAAFLSGIDPWDLQVQGAHGVGGFGQQLRLAVLLWGSSSLGTVGQFRTFMHNAAAAHGDSFGSDAVYAGDVTMGGQASVPVTPAYVPPVNVTTPVATPAPTTTRSSTTTPTRGVTPSPVAPATTILDPTHAASGTTRNTPPISTSPAPAIVPGSVPVYLPSNAIQPCIPVFNHEGSEFTCILSGNPLPQGYNLASVAIQSGGILFYAGLLPEFWLEVGQTGGVPVLQQNNHAGTVAILHGADVPDLTHPATPPVTIIAGPPLSIPRSPTITPRTAPQVCIAGTVYDAITGHCISASTPTPTPPPTTTPTCPSGSQFNALTGQCEAQGTTPEACPPGQYFGADGNCHFVGQGQCPPSQYWDATVQACVTPGLTPPPATCPTGQLFNSTTGQCYAPQPTTPAPTIPIAQPTTPTSACIGVYNHEGSQFDCVQTCPTAYPLEQTQLPNGDIVQACLLPGFHLGQQNGAAVIIAPTTTGGGGTPTGGGGDGSTPTGGGDGTTPTTSGGSFLDSLATSTGISKTTLTWVLIGGAGLLLFGKR